MSAKVSLQTTFEEFYICINCGVQLIHLVFAGTPSFESASIANAGV
jgi:hypothetical protein